MRNTRSQTGPPGDETPSADDQKTRARTDPGGSLEVDQDSTSVGFSGNRANGESTSSASSGPTAGTSSTNGGTSSKHKSSGTSNSGGNSSGGSGTIRHDQRRGLAEIQNAAAQIFCAPFRQIVSQNRRRYKLDGFNLDLTYITDRIIAMGYPADTTEALYRNSMADTVKFLESRHQGHYKVFNLRGQYVYDTARFQNRVLSFEMTDHHPPRLELMAPFCREVHDYLNEDKRNVVAVHCKAGKGRTGVMICAYLTYVGFYPTPRQNMDYYSILRTMNNKGVTIPSQRRYIYYFSHLREHHLNYIPMRVELVGVYVEKPPKVSSKFSRRAISLRVANGDVPVFLGDDIWITREESEQEQRLWEGACSKGADSFDPDSDQDDFAKRVISRRAYGWTVPSNKRVFLQGDVRMDILIKPKNVLSFSDTSKKLGHIWWNTMFACKGFCKSQYRHGDEAYPYPPGGTTISQPKSSHRPKSGSASVPSSPPLSPMPASSSGRTAARAPSFDSRKNRSSGRLNSVVKRFTDAAVPSRNSEPNIERKAKERKSGGRHSKKTFSNPSLEDVEILTPPGLDLHCPPESLAAIYGEKEPPRKCIDDILRDAHAKNLISDSYNERRLSVPQDGSPVALAQEGRPPIGGPVSLLRRPDEHVQVYNLLEVDRACKNNSIDPGLKIIVITRCVAAEGSEQCSHFLNMTHKKQKEIDDTKQKNVEERQRKIQEGSGGSSQVPIEQANTESCRDDAQWNDDGRVHDSYLKRFFYRQRSDSLSRYPEMRYKCPLLGSVVATPIAPQSHSKDSPASPLPGCSSTTAKIEDDVRSYHPAEDEPGPWSSSSSEESQEGETDNAEDEAAKTPLPPPDSS